MDINLAIADRARAGESLNEAELDELGTADLLSLGMLADEVRRDRLGATVTYARVLEVPVQGAKGAEAAKGAQVRLVGVPGSLDAAVAAVTAGRRLAGTARLTGFSLADLADGANAGWGALPKALEQLKDAGLDAVAEAPVDRLADPAAALQACADAGLRVSCLCLDRPFTGSRAALLLKVRSLAGRFPWLETFAPLPRQQSVAAPTTGYDDVRAVALARLALPGVPNIQVDWAQYGPKLAQVALTFGANAVDRVSPVDDPALGPRRTSVEDVRRNISAAGFTPVEQSAGA